MQQEWQLQLAGLKLAGWLHQPAHSDSQAPLIVACHGWLDNANSFLPLARRLNHHRLLAFDWPGHGHSEHLPAAANYHFVDWADVLFQVIDSLNQPVVLLGHSMGALVSTLVAAAFPEQVRQLVLIEGAGPLTAQPEEVTSMLRKGLLSRQRSRGKLGRRYSSLEQAVAARLNASPDLTEALVRLIVERNLEKSDDGVRWRYDPRLKAFSAIRMTEPQAEQLVSSIPCPVLAVTADQGYQGLKQQLESRQHCFKSLQKVILCGGHHVHMTRPDALAQKIVEFVAVQNSNT